MTLVAGAVLVLTVAVLAEVLIGGRTIGELREGPSLEDGAAPSVSVIVAARDEARGVEAAVRSMLAQDYPRLELVVVDDRSSDGTGAILDRLAASDPRLTVVHLTSLPSGWLGKNHALHVGAARASGDFLLFTDADVEMRPDTLRRAVGYCERRGVDHLAVAPDIVLPGLLLQAFAVFFVTSFLIYVKPWRVRDPRSRFHIGLGAFNLVRRVRYLAAGGHEPIRLRPDDDLKLGLVLKRSGCRQDAVSGRGMVRVEWYHSLAELVRGLEKNMFAGIEYRAWLSIAAGLGQLAFGLGPLAGAVFAPAPARWLFAAQVAVTLAGFAVIAWRLGIRTRTAWLAPVVVVLFVAILWRTMALNLWEGGIRWRGTFYSLSELRGNRV